MKGDVRRTEKSSESLPSFRFLSVSEGVLTEGSTRHTGTLSLSQNDPEPKKNGLYLYYHRLRTVILLIYVCINCRVSDPEPVLSTTYLSGIPDDDRTNLVTKSDYARDTEQSERRVTTGPKSTRQTTSLSIDVVLVSIEKDTKD